MVVTDRPECASVTPEAISVPSATPGANEASACGKLLDHSASGTEQVLTLEFRMLDGSVRTFRYRLA